MSFGKPEPHNLLAGLLKAESREPDQELDRLAHEVIGAAIEVHRQLGPGPAQVISYLRITGHRLGLVINFNVSLLRDGIKRIVLS